MVDHVAINTSPKANRLRRILYTLSNQLTPRFIIQKVRNKRERSDLLVN